MTFYILGTMLCAGVLGGAINYFQEQSDNNLNVNALLKNIIIGIGASFIVPVFLNMISSQLISEITGQDVTNENLSKLLILAGFCLIASISSRSFITTMTNKLMRELDEVKSETQQIKKASNELQEVVSLSIEPENESDTDLTSNSENNINISKSEAEVLATLTNENYKLRTLTGISEELSMSRERAKQILDSLEEKDLVKPINRSTKRYWAITSSGLIRVKKT